MKWGKSDIPQIEFADSLEDSPSVVSLTLDQVLERRVEMTLARQAVEQAQANLRLQQANGKPDPDLQLGYERIGGFDTIYAAAQIPLPIRNRNQGQIEAAAADIKAAESLAAATEATIRSELESAARDYESRQKLLNETLRPMRGRADEVYRDRGCGVSRDRIGPTPASGCGTDQNRDGIMYTRALSELQQSAVALETAQGSLP